jgi:hypothetical protein
MAKRLGGVLLGFGVNRAGEFCISYNVRLGDMCARAVFPHYYNSTRRAGVRVLCATDCTILYMNKTAKRKREQHA